MNQIVDAITHWLICAQVFGHISYAPTYVPSPMPSKSDRRLVVVLLAPPVDDAGDDRVRLRHFVYYLDDEHLVLLPQPEKIQTFGFVVVHVRT